MPIDPREPFPAHLGEISDVTRIAGGMSGAVVYAVTATSGKFVLRTERDRNSWNQAITLQRLASDAGIAPTLVAIDERSATSISVLIEGMPFAVAAGQPAHRSAAPGTAAVDGEHPAQQFGRFEAPPALRGRGGSTTRSSRIAAHVGLGPAQSACSLRTATG